MLVISKTCIKECRKCMTQCKKCCDTHKNKKAMKDCIKSCECCIILCKYLCEMIKCDERSTMTKQLARLCAMCCKKCMTQCAKHKTDKVCKACHAACKKCHAVCLKCCNSKRKSKSKSKSKMKMKMKGGEMTATQRSNLETMMTSLREFLPIPLLEHSNISPDGSKVKYTPEELLAIYGADDPLTASASLLPNTTDTTTMMTPSIIKTRMTRDEIVKARTQPPTSIHLKGQLLWRLWAQLTSNTPGRIWDQTGQEKHIRSKVEKAPECISCSAKFHKLAGRVPGKYKTRHHCRACYNTFCNNCVKKYRVTKMEEERKDLFCEPCFSTIHNLRENIGWFTIREDGVSAASIFVHFYNELDDDLWVCCQDERGYYVRNTRVPSSTAVRMSAIQEGTVWVFMMNSIKSAEFTPFNVITIKSGGNRVINVFSGKDMNGVPTGTRTLNEGNENNVLDAAPAAPALGTLNDENNVPDAAAAAPAAPAGASGTQIVNRYNVLKPQIIKQQSTRFSDSTTLGFDETQGPKFPNDHPERGRYIRPTMEDTMTVYGNFKDTHHEDFFAAYDGHDKDFFAVYDGHGGDDVSEWCHDNLHIHVIDQINRISTNNDQPIEQVMIQAFKRSFDEADKALRKAFQTNETRIYSTGSTVAVCVLIGRLLVSANLGDARAVLGRTDYEAIPLTKDHKPEVPNEMARIKGQGGNVYQNPAHRALHPDVPYRVYKADGHGGLAISRALGDIFLTPLVSIEPYVNVRLLKENDAVLIIACDGVWDVMTNEEAVRCVYDELQQTDSAQSAASKLMETAKIHEAQQDNISVMVIDLRRVTSSGDV